jgi:hypothetical protein
MEKEAAAARFYKPDGDLVWRKPFPKIQIVTVEDLFKQANPLHLPFQDTSVFKKAAREKKATSQSELDL